MRQDFDQNFLPCSSLCKNVSFWYKNVVINTKILDTADITRIKLLSQDKTRQNSYPRTPPRTRSRLRWINFLLEIYVFKTYLNKIRVVSWKVQVRSWAIGMTSTSEECRPNFSRRSPVTKTLSKKQVQIKVQTWARNQTSGLIRWPKPNL